MFSLETAREEWAVRSRTRSPEPVMRITEAGLVLGGTVLAKVGRDAGGLPQLAVEGTEEHILALLALAYGKAVRPAILGYIRRASTEWRRGERCLAQIHLVHGGLPRLPDEEGTAFRMFLGERLLAEGVPPRDFQRDGPP